MSGQHVLVVDDEAGLRETLAANLELEGFSVVEAGSAEEALTLLGTRSFDLIMSDIRMPGMHGVDFFRKVRALGHQTPVVLMTGFALEELVQSAMEEGAFAVLSKPFDVAHALTVVNTAARGPVILVVDDARALAESTCAALEQLGLSAVPAGSGEEALEVLKQRYVDLCVVDLVMPGMSGPELVRKAREVDPSVAVIAVSGEDVPEMIRHVAATGMHAFLQKPVASRELVRCVAAARAAHRKAAPPR